MRRLLYMIMLLSSAPVCADIFTGQGSVSMVGINDFDLWGGRNKLLSN
jgi:hypothetical protein